MHTIKATLTIAGKPIWFCVNHIIALTVNDDGDAVVITTAGTYAVDEKPEELLRNEA